MRKVRVTVRTSTRKIVSHKISFWHRDVFTYGLLLARNKAPTTTTITTTIIPKDYYQKLPIENNNNNNNNNKMSSDKPPREYVESLVSKGAYKTMNKTTYEEYVDAQIAGDGEYYFEANRALLKVYQFLPQSINTSKVASVLLLSMLQYSTQTTDFLALSYMVPDRIQKVEPVASIIQCHSLLDGCQFVEFWERFDKLSEHDELKSFVGATKTKETLQREILQVLSLTYKSIPVDKVLKLVNMKSGSEVTQLNDSCVESVTDKTVTFVSTPDNTKRNRVFQEGVSYGALANLMSKVAAAE